MKKNKEEKFKVRITKWVDGALTTINKKFEGFKDAKKFIEKQKENKEEKDEKIKIYNPDGECIHNEVHHHENEHDDDDDMYY
jgi:hypothetical protein